MLNEFLELPSVTTVLKNRIEISVISLVTFNAWYIFLKDEIAVKNSMKNVFALIIACNILNF